LLIIVGIKILTISYVKCAGNKWYTM